MEAQQQARHQQHDLASCHKRESPPCTLGPAGALAGLAWLLTARAVSVMGSMSCFCKAGSQCGITPGGIVGLAVSSKQSLGGQQAPAHPTAQYCEIWAIARLAQVLTTAELAEL